VALNTIKQTNKQTCPVENNRLAWCLLELNNFIFQMWEKREQTGPTMVQYHQHNRQNYILSAC
jgi:hypothetical protein